MTTKEILSKSSILVGQEFSDRKEATIAAGKLLFQNGYTTEEYIDSMVEKLETQTFATYIGNGVAIPHGMSDGEKHVIHTGISVIQIPVDADIVVCHKGLAGVAKSSAPEGSVLIQYMLFMNDPALSKLIQDLSEGNQISST